MHEPSYHEGRRRAWLTMLQTCLTALGIHDPTVEQAAWVLERQELVITLKRLCAKTGTTDEWNDDAHLADILHTYIEPYIRREKGAEE